MLRLATGVGAAIFLVLAGFFVWKGRAAADPTVLTMSRAAVETPAVQEQGGGHRRHSAFAPPAASDKNKEERRFARADKDKDGKIELAELLDGRRKAFAKIDANHDGQLSFEEGTAKTRQKFTDADADHTGWLSATEYAETAPRRKAHPARCACAA